MPRLPRPVRVLTVLTGSWLALAPFVWNDGDTGGGFNARWNDSTAGLALVIAGCAQFIRPERLTAVTVPFLLGVWLAIAPFTLAYNLGTDPTAATANDTIVGILLTGFTMWGYLSARDGATRHQRRS